MSSLSRRARHGQDGQILVPVALLFVILLGLVGIVVDIGRALHAQRELQASADAAATAGALDLPNSTAVTTANLYSGISGGKNAYSDLPNVTMASGYPLVRCLSSTGQPCDPPAAGNAVAVQEQVSVPTIFAKVFGFNSFTVTANALATERSGVPVPMNVVLIVDTTASMRNTDSKCTVPGLNNPTKEDCAKGGVRTLLSNLWPCSSSLGSCGTVTNGNVANPDQEVALLVFPGLTSSTYASYDYANCQANSIKPYLAPYSSSTNYDIVTFSSDYRTSATSGLNGGSSPLVQAVDWTDGANCPTSSYGLQDPGGEGTYYAGAIKAAQTLFPTSGSRSTVQNAIIIVSDGDANASGSQISKSLAANQCHQAITAAQNAAASGTWVYTIAYGASTSSSNSCSTDSPPISACSALTQMASSHGAIPDPSKFYSDDAAGCASTDHPSITSLSQIFQQISYDFMSSRLLPFNTQ